MGGKRAEKEKKKIRVKIEARQALCNTERECAENTISRMIIFTAIVFYQSPVKFLAQREACAIQNEPKIGIHLKCSISAFLNGKVGVESRIEYLRAVITDFIRSTPGWYSH
jgi:hypothetical protein